MESVYYDPKNAASLGGKRRLQKAIKGDPSEWLASQRAYTLHKPARKRFATRRTRTTHFASQYQADLNDMIAYSSVNKGFRYILTVIDVFSRRACALPLKSKTGEEMVQAFDKIFHTSLPPPHLLQTDEGKEFENKTFQSFLKQNKVRHFSVKSPYKASLVERYNRTLKTRMFRYFTHKGNYKWVDVLPDLVKSYNEGPHRSLPNHLTPMEASQPQHHYHVWLHQERLEQEEDLTEKFKVGDEVRISKAKGTFEKGYLANWSEEVFTVSGVDKRHAPVMYTIKDSIGEEIKGKFYALELQKVSNPEGLYAIEKVIRRGKGGRYLVKFLGYPGEHWVNGVERI